MNTSRSSAFSNPLLSRSTYNIAPMSAWYTACLEGAPPEQESQAWP